MSQLYKLTRQNEIAKRTRRFALLALLGSVLALVMSAPMAGWAAATIPDLGTAGSFGVLVGSTVTNTGPTIIQGDLGVSPGTAVTGFPPGIVNGTIHAGDTVALQAQNDASTAYDTAAQQACDFNLTGQDLGGMTLTSGVYCFNSSAQLTGQLTLSGQGNPNSFFIFKIGSSLTTASNAIVSVISSAQPCNVFWQVGSSATLGTNTNFAGNILALMSVTLNTGATTSAGLYALNGAITLDTNAIEACGFGQSTTNTPTLVSTGTATATPTVTATLTMVPPTNTSTQVATNTPVNISTLTPTGTATLTPSVTAVPTHTAVPTDTATAIASSTVTLVPSTTAVAPYTASSTPSGTGTAIASSTVTSVPSTTAIAPDTASSTPSGTATAIALATSTSIAATPTTVAVIVTTTIASTSTLVPTVAMPEDTSSTKQTTMFPTPTPFLPRTGGGNLWAGRFAVIVLGLWLLLVGLVIRVPFGPESRIKVGTDEVELPRFK